LITLSTHVFYRALENVPQLVRNWYEACKDRQLAMAFIAIVQKHLSPVLIEHEFAVIRAPGILKNLEDDELSVRILSASGEITARYVIDEQPMEILIKLPQDYPLRNVEVKEINRVGVTEGKWRGWMINVQQLVMSRVSTPWHHNHLNIANETAGALEWSSVGGSQAIQVERFPAFRGEDRMCHRKPNQTNLNSRMYLTIYCRIL
jgi:hypothetical protein